MKEGVTLQADFPGRLAGPLGRLASSQADAFATGAPRCFSRPRPVSPLAGRVIRDVVLALAAGVGAIVDMLAPEVVVREVRDLVLCGTQPFAARTVAIDGATLRVGSSLYGAGYLAHSLIGREDPQ
jgi:predicted NBD/HSP70 family sugar kinase